MNTKKTQKHRMSGFFTKLTIENFKETGNNMKKTLPVFLFLFLFVYTSVFAQLGNVLKQTKKLADKVVKIDLLEEKTITTSIDDALPVAYWLKDLDTYLTPVEPGNYDFVLGPGYYRFKVQSYCLKAGTYGPSKGDGYLLSPLRGNKSDVVYNIVKRSVEHPEIAQQDIQVLLWGIIYGTKFTDYDPAFQQRVKPLLTPVEMADLSIDLKNIAFDVMPDAVKKTAKFYSDFRNKLTNPNLVFGDIERMAMLDGVLPDDPFSQYVQQGLWAYIGNGFYGRAMPESYPTTVYEIYRPEEIYETWDAKKRLVKLEKGGYSIEIGYDDAPGQDIISFGSDGDYPIWRMKTILLKGPEAGQELLLNNAGWIIRGSGEKLKSSKNAISLRSSESSDPSLAEYQQRYNNLKNASKAAGEYAKAFNPKGNFDKEDYENKHDIKEGLEKALNPTDKKGQLKWIDKHLNKVKDWWNCASTSLFGGSCSDEPAKANLPRNPAVPATNGKQRIIPSERPVRK